jgi:5'-3' exonuclease
MTYIIVDTANLFFRARHVVRGDLDTQIGMCLLITFNAVRKAWRDFDGSHVVFCLEGRSWRKDFYEPYKRNRKEGRDAMTPRQMEEEELFWEIFDEFKNYLNEKTNCTVLQHKQLEADDLIAGWVQHHPNEKHVIISTDGDFAQLISENVTQYNGVSQTTTTIKGYFDDKGYPIVEKKTGEEKPAPDPKWLLFEKCMRGDTSDNVFSAYPGVRKKGTKKKIGLLEAYADRTTKGYDWNNMMLQRWVDHLGEEHRVKTDYERNVTLCDLTAQPEEIKEIIKETIVEATAEPKNISQVGIRLMKFCAKWDIKRVTEQIQTYNEQYSSRYTNES